MERIIIGENSYISIAEADEIIAKTYSDNDTLANYWLCAEDDDKAGYLLASMDEIEAQPMRGRKYYIYQKLSFPRFGVGNFFDMFVHENVKKAQAINALALLNKDMGDVSGKGQYLTSKRAEWLLKEWLHGTFVCV